MLETEYFIAAVATIIAMTVMAVHFDIWAMSSGANSAKEESGPLLDLSKYPVLARHLRITWVDPEDEVTVDRCEDVLL